MLIDALPRELFLTIGTISAGLEPGLRGALSTVFTLLWMMAVVRMVAFHFLCAAECARQGSNQKKGTPSAGAGFFRTAVG